MKYIKLFEQFIGESIKLDEPLITMQPAKWGNGEHPTHVYDPKKVLKFLRKEVSKTGQKALSGAYIDGGEAIVHNRSSKTIAHFYLNVTIKDLVDQVENFVKNNRDLFNVSVSDADLIEIKSDTRAIVAVDIDTAAEIKRQVHNSKEKIKVRIMTRKDGAKVYIDTANKEGLDKAIAQVKEITK